MRESDLDVSPGAVEIWELLRHSYFQCPKCSERTHIFSHGGAAATAAKFGVPFLGEVPLASALVKGETPEAHCVADPDSPGAQAFIQHCTESRVPG